MLRLASSSRRRVDLLSLVQVPFEATAPNVDEARFASPARAKADESHAVAMLASLSGRAHEVRTAVVVVAASGARMEFAVRSSVTLHDLSLRQIERYVGTREPLGKAGAYAIQGEGRRIVESYFALRRVGVVGRERPEVVCQTHVAFVCPVWRAAQRQGRALRDGGEYRSWSDDASGVQ